VYDLTLGQGLVFIKYQRGLHVVNNNNTRPSLQDNPIFLSFQQSAFDFIHRKASVAASSGG
jgi:hypothetical protein